MTVEKQPRSWKRTCLIAVSALVAVVLVCGVIAALFAAPGPPEPETTIIAEPSPVAATEEEPASAPQEPAPAASEPAEAPTPEPSPTSETLPTIGEDVVVGEVRWKVLEAENVGNVVESGNEFMEDATTTGTFIRVVFEVENLANQQANYDGAQLVDSQGRTFRPNTNEDLMAIQFANESEPCTFERLNANVPKTCEEWYEVPSDATGLKLEATNLAFVQQEKRLIDLGLE